MSSLSPVSPTRVLVLLGDESPSQGEEDASDLWTAVTFVILFLLSLFYSTGVTLFKVPTPAGAPRGLING